MLRVDAHGQSLCRLLLSVHALQRHVLQLVLDAVCEHLDEMEALGAGAIPRLVLRHLVPFYLLLLLLLLFRRALSVN